MPSPLSSSPKRARVLASLEEWRHRWDPLIAKEGPRLFASSLDRKGQIDGRGDYSKVVAAAEKLLTVPPPVYASKEEEVQRHNLNYSDAKQELWLRPVGDQIVLLAFALRLSGRADFRAHLKSFVLAVCRFPSWGIGWKREWEQVGDHMDLACAHAARAVAMAWDWHSAIWERDEADLITATIAERAGQLLRGSYGEAFWAESYGDNHNHVGMCALAWCGLAFYREIAEAPEWLAASRLNFQAVGRQMPTDGASHEGVPYWSYGLSYILQYVEATRGCLDSAALYEQAFLTNAARYRLHASTCGFEAVLPWGDARAQDYYGPHFILHRLAAQYGDGQAAWLAGQIPFEPKGFLDVLVWDAWWRRPIAAQAPGKLDHHCRETDLLTTRSGWKREDYLLALKSGFTNRNHSHLDAGALALAFGSEWLLTAPGYGQGASQSDFWDRAGGRWRYFSNATESHSTLLIENGNQASHTKARGTIEAFFAAPLHVWARVDLTAAYSEVETAKRLILHSRRHYVVVLDEVLASREISAEWLAQVSASHVVEGGFLFVRGNAGSLRVRMLAPELPFTVRAPRSGKVDIPPERIHTYSVAQSGRAISFAALLQPLAINDTTQLESEAQITADRYFLRIAGLSWSDEVVASRSGSAISLNLGNSTALTAASAVLHTEQTGLGAGSALEARSVTTTAFTWTAQTPAALAWQQLTPNEWIVECDTPVAATFLQPASGFSISATDEAPDGEAHTHRCLVRKK